MVAMVAATGIIRVVAAATVVIRVMYAQLRWWHASRVARASCFGLPTPATAYTTCAPGGGSGSGKACPTTCSHNCTQTHARTCLRCHARRTRRGAGPSGRQLDRAAGQRPVEATRTQTSAAGRAARSIQTDPRCSLRRVTRAALIGLARTPMTEVVRDVLGGQHPQLRFGKPSIQHNTHRSSHKHVM